MADAQGKCKLKCLRVRLLAKDTRSKKGVYGCDSAAGASWTCTALPTWWVLQILQDAEYLLPSGEH